MSVSSQSLVGSIVPRPYFKRVILESGQYTYPYEWTENPHIDPRAHGGGGSGGSTFLGGWSEGKAHPSGLGIEYGEGKEQQLNVTVEIVLKETFNPDSPGYSWFKEEGFKYLSIGVLQVTSESDIELLSNLPKENQSFLMNMLTNASSSEFEAFSDMYTELGFETSLNQFYKNREIESLSSFFNDEDEIVNFDNLQNIAEVHGDGSRTYTIPITFKFDVPNTANPSSLCYFAGASFNKQAILESQLLSGLDLGDDSFVDEFTNFLEVNSEMVIRNGEVVNAATVFKIAESGYENTHGNMGDIWAGPVHYDMNHGWLAGNKSVYIPGMFNETVALKSPKLHAQSVPNYTVQDFRKIEQIENMNIDTSFLKQPIFGLYGSFSKVKLLSKDPSALELSEQKYPYFSDAWISIGQPNNHPSSGTPIGGKELVTFMFAFDYERALMDNMMFSNLYPKLLSSDKNKIINYSKILSMKVYRRRVKKHVFDNSRIGSPGASMVPYDGEEDLIGFAYENDAGAFKSDNYKNENPGIGDSYPKTIAQIPADYLHSADQQGVRFFSCIDPNVVAQKDYGHYQYGVEIKIKDGSLDFFKEEILDPLLSALSFFEKIYEVASLPAHYDVKTSKFTNIFLENTLPTMFGNTDTDDELQKHILSIGVVMAIISDSGATMNVSQNLEDEMTKLIYPFETATLKGYGAYINAIKNISDQMIAFFNSLSGGNLFKLSKYEASENWNVSPNPSNSHVRKEFVIKEYFENVLDADREYNVGYNFIRKVFKGKDNYHIPTITKIAYDERITKALNSVYNPLPSTIRTLAPPGAQINYIFSSADISKYAYLTPEVICMPQNQLTMKSPGSVESDYYNLTTDKLATIINYNLGLVREGGEYLIDNAGEKLGGSYAAKGDLRRYKINDILEQKNCTLNVELPAMDAGMPAYGAIADAIFQGLQGIEPLLVAYGARELKLLSEQMKLTSYDPDNDNSLFTQAAYYYDPNSTLIPHQLHALAQVGVAKYDYYQKQELPPGSGQFFNLGLGWNKMADFIFRHMIIFQVQAFMGFKVDNYESKLDNGTSLISPTKGARSLSAPIWNILSGDLYNSFIGTGKSLFCRMVPYEAEFNAPMEGRFFVGGETFSFKQIKSLQLPIYNEYFVIKF